MIYIYGHAPSDHPEEFGDKDMALQYLREWLPKDNHFRYRTTYNVSQIDSIIFSFGGELLGELVVDYGMPPTNDDRKRYDKAKRVYIIREIRLFNNKSFRIKDFGLTYAQSGLKISEEIYYQIIETVGGFEQPLLKKPRPTLDYARLAAYYKAFVDYLEQQCDCDFESFSTDPFIEREENYKYRVHTQALEKLSHQDWQESDIGSGKILNCVIDAIEVKDNNLIQLNLGSRFGDERRYHQVLIEAKKQPNLTKQWEELFYDFFVTYIEDGAAFEKFIEFAGRKYVFIAYLFFLKDWSRYLPIAPDTFDAAFVMVGTDFKTSRHCSWENYLTYNRLIAEVRDFLATQLTTEVRLLDAHSFLWIIARPPKLTIVDKEVEYIEYHPKAPPAIPSDLVGPIGTVDYLKKHEQQIIIGRSAEDHVLLNEQIRLRKLGRYNLANQVERVADNPLLGFDIRSFELDGTERQIEVKVVRSWGKTKTFFLTENERKKSQTLPNYYLYLVGDLGKDSPEIWVVSKPNFYDKSQFNLEAVNYRVSIE